MYYHDQIEMCVLSESLSITPYHPIFQQSKWCFPYQLESLHKTSLQAHTVLYNIVLDQPGQHLELASFEQPNRTFGVSSLGHDEDENPILKHSFWGSRGCFLGFF